MSEWWYQKGGEKAGPLSKDQVREVLLADTISLQTLVWTEGMESWQPISEVDALQDLRQSLPPPLPPKSSGLDLLTYTMAGPWRRFCARMFDVWWESLVVVTAISWTLGRTSAGYLDWIRQPASGQLLALLCLPLTLVLDAAVYRIFSNSPGKALLGLKVGTIRGEPLSFNAYVRRNLRLWGSGLGLGIPLVNLVTMLQQSSRIKRNEPASYDVTAGHRVRAKPIGLGSRAAFTVLFLGLFGVMGYLRSVEQELDRKEFAAQTTPQFTWQNPVSKASVSVNSRWTFTSQQNEQGQPILTFSEPSNHAAVILAEEVVPGASLHPYVKAFAQNNLGRMVFDDAGASASYGGLPAWVLTGHLAEDATNHALVEIVQQGDRFWRIVIIQSPPYEYTKSLVDELRQALRNSIAPASRSST